VDTLPIKCGIAAQAKIANLFCLDSMATDGQRFQLPAGGLYVDVGDQYAFNAEKRAMSPQFSLLWLDDVLLMIADEEEMSAGSAISPRSAQFAQQNGSSVLPNEMDEQLSLHSPQTENELEDIASCFEDPDVASARASPPEMGANSEEASEASSIPHDDQQHDEGVLTEAVTDEIAASAPQSIATIAEVETEQPAASEPVQEAAAVQDDAEAAAAEDRSNKKVQIHVKNPEEMRRAGKQGRAAEERCAAEERLELATPAEAQQDEPQATDAEHVQQDSQVQEPEKEICIDF